MARKYQHTQESLPKLKEMLEGGMTQREVAERLGVTGERAIHHLLTRERKKELHGIPKQRGRKPAKALAEYKYENKRLKMEVELLRDSCSLGRSEDQRKIQGHISTQKRVSHQRNVSFF